MEKIYLPKKINFLSFGKGGDKFNINNDKIKIIKNNPNLNQKNNKTLKRSFTAKVLNKSYVNTKNIKLNSSINDNSDIKSTKNISKLNLTINVKQNNKNTFKCIYKDNDHVKSIEKVLYNNISNNIYDINYKFNSPNYKFLRLNKTPKFFNNSNMKNNKRKEIFYDKVNKTPLNQNSNSENFYSLLNKTSVKTINKNEKKRISRNNIINTLDKEKYKTYKFINDLSKSTGLQNKAIKDLIYNSKESLRKENGTVFIQSKNNLYYAINSKNKKQNILMKRRCELSEIFMLKDFYMKKSENYKNYFYKSFSVAKDNGHSLLIHSYKPNLRLLKSFYHNLKNSPSHTFKYK